MYTEEYCENNLINIGKGASRTVFAINLDYVVKVAHNKFGVDQNIQEMKLFQKYGKILPLCKIDLYHSNENYIIMERINTFNVEYNAFDITQIDMISHLVCVEQIDNDYISTLPPVLAEFANNLLSNELSNDEIRNVLYDVVHYNVGIKDGKILILDYGFTKELDSEYWE
ncbi:hypothetical protein [Yersinia phage fHe-Yen9-04]|uniref:Protein kinase domain-containing protein n=1 Tax=Yersinia phage fHe-Yen9-04 TaxID=2052742 RepID=A0A2C9CXS1_9CAUD|nr:hypothetical protein FDJ41_gp461 [Yersinia phage fHe-Yen9-04]SOK58719.1 hypothetical protein [Yersinia phage fHe-Yen9-04]VUE36488.1 hypothetical protein [Yersinia phage fHe-Yen9-04]